MNLNLSVLKEKIKFYPNKLQSTVLRNMNRFTVVASGKRGGKSTLCAYLALKELHLPYHVTWIIGPNYEVASRVWDYVAEWIERYFTDERGNSSFLINRHDKKIMNKLTGSKLWMKSGEELSTLLGKGLDLAIIDEAARIGPDVWEGYIRPNLMDRGGRAILISNPYGFNWFYDLYMKGTPGSVIDNPEYISFHFTTAIENEHGEVIGSINPKAINIQELISIKKTTPRDRWNSEYLGVFKEGAGQLFKGYEKCIDESIVVEDQNEWFEKPKSGHLYSLGCDIAKLQDFTVICVIDRMDHRLIGFWRDHNRTWEYTRQKLKELSLRYNDAEITLDTTGMGGDIFAENLQEIGVNVDTEFKYSSRSKMMLIDKLVLFLERGQIRFPKLLILINELKTFTYNITLSGNLKYGSSKHDDTVNALALACWNLTDTPLMDDFNILIYNMKSKNYS